MVTAMKTLLPVFAAAIVLAACGRQDQPQRSDTTGEAPSSATPSTPTGGAPAGSGAALQLNATQGNTATGMLAVASAADGVHLSGALQGLKPDAEFGFHIHEKGDCSAPDASSAGEHFNPAGAQHGNPSAGAHHAGDMLNVKSDAQGMAKVDVHASGVTLNSGQANDVLGKAVVLHEKPDDYATQPSGNSGARIACGVISN
jgi:superoxide dismutase, Cu-Zn family